MMMIMMIMTYLLVLHKQKNFDFMSKQKIRNKFLHYGFAYKYVYLFP